MHVLGLLVAFLTNPWNLSAQDFTKLIRFDTLEWQGTASRRHYWCSIRIGTMVIGHVILSCWAKHCLHVPPVTSLPTWCIKVLLIPARGHVGLTIAILHLTISQVITLCHMWAIRSWMLISHSVLDHGWLHLDLFVVFIIENLQFFLKRVLVVHLIIRMVVRLSCANIVVVIVKRALLLSFYLLLLLL